MAEDFGQRMIAALEAGRQSRRQQQQDEIAKTERQAHQEILKYQQQRLKMEDVITQYKLQREAAQGRVEAQTGQPQASFMESVPQAPAGTLAPGVELPNTGGAAVNTGPRPVTFPGLPPEVGGGSPSYQQTPTTMEEIVQAQMAAKLRDIGSTPQKVGPGERVVMPGTGETIAEGGARPVSLQSVNRLVGGTPQSVNFNPQTGAYTDQAGQPVPDVKPIPPASSGGAAGPGEGLTDEGVDFAATMLRLTGKMPPMGMGKTPDRAKIINRTAEQAKLLGQTPVAAIQKQAAFKADGSALTKMRAMASAAEAFETKADAQADIVVDLSGRVKRTQIPLVNAALLSGKKEIQGDADTQLLFNALTTFTTEYAKIMEGSTGSAAGSSDSARKASERLVKASLNHEALQKTVALMQREMQLTMAGYDATMQHITERMGGQPGPPAAGISVTAPDGSVHPFDTQAQADAFKKLAGIP